MSDDTTRSEIKKVFNNFRVTLDKSFTDDQELSEVISKVENCNGSERPDAYLEIGQFIYGIEHFQVSNYTKVKKTQDISQIAKGSMEHRDKMKSDREFNLEPSTKHLIDAINRSLISHSKSFESYKDNIEHKFPSKKYRLIIFIEDSSESAAIVRKQSSNTKPINPLQLRQIAESILKFKDIVYAVLYSYGDEQSKILTGCTLNELDDRLKSDNLLDAEFYTPFHYKRQLKVSKQNEKEDENNITIRIYDHL